jgi:hypothetical protein
MDAPDRKTRGRTSPGRLRALDAYLLEAEAALLSTALGDAAFVDVGFGEHPWTTLETAAAFEDRFPGVPVIGVEREPERVEAAQVHARERLSFVCGGFDRLASLGPARVVRAMNVLRTYPEAQARDAHALLSVPLIEGGLVLEGSADPDGALLTAHLLRRRDGRLHREALLFFTDFSRGFAPLMFRDWLPRDLRRRVLPGEWVRDFFDAWTGAWAEVREIAGCPERAFVESARRLAERLPGIERAVEWGERGYLIYRPAGGVPISGAKAQ